MQLCRQAFRLKSTPLTLAIRTLGVLMANLKCDAKSQDAGTGRSAHAQTAADMHNVCDMTTRLKLYTQSTEAVCKTINTAQE